MPDRNMSLAEAESYGWTNEDERKARANFFGDFLAQVIIVPALVLYFGGGVLKSRVLDSHVRKTHNIPESVHSTDYPLFSLNPNCWANRTFFFPDGSERAFCSPFGTDGSVTEQ